MHQNPQIPDVKRPQFTIKDNSCKPAANADMILCFSKGTIFITIKYRRDDESCSRGQPRGRH